MKPILMYFKPAVATSLGQALYPCAISDEVWCGKYTAKNNSITGSSEITSLCSTKCSSEILQNVF